jgi:transcriptional regulator with XRE-family HTH domain
MNDYNKDIGNRIRELRELSDITIKEIADDLNITEETYIQYENAEVDIPASFLYELAHIFKVDLGLLLTGEESRMSIFDVTRANKGVSIDRSKEYTHENLCSNFIHKKAETFLVTIDPKENATPSPNSHPGQEFNYVLEGSIKITVYHNEIILNEGDCIFFDSTQEHALVALNDKPAKILAVII